MKPKIFYDNHISDLKLKCCAGSSARELSCRGFGSRALLWDLGSGFWCWRFGVLPVDLGNPERQQQMEMDNLHSGMVVGRALAVPMS